MYALSPLLLVVTSTVPCVSAAIGDRMNNIVGAGEAARVEKRVMRSSRSGVESEVRVRSRKSWCVAVAVT